MTVFGGRAPEANADMVPVRTTPTWEMEMLLSGATVFGLLQLPDALLGVVEPLLTRLGDPVATVANILAMYVGAAVHLLLATFIGHLVIRGLWIALLGLRSVFPGGPDFDRLRGGPISRDVARRQTPRIEDEIERLDNFASIVFMFGAITVIGVLMPGVLVLPVLVAAWLWPSISIFVMMAVLLGITLGPMALAGLADSAFGRHLDRNGRPARLLAAVLGFFQHISQPRFLNVLTTTLMTRLGFGRFMTVYMTVLLVVLFGYALHGAMRRNGISIGDYTAIPAQSESGYAVLPEHYRDQWGTDDRLRRVPFLDAAMIEGDWLRLVVPYHPTRHEIAIAARCPDVWATLPLADDLDLPASDAAHRALLGCYRDLAALHIDGRRVEVLPDIVVLPGSRLRGLQFMIDVRGLPPGRHLLETAALPDPRDDDAGAKPASYRIPFWK